MRINSDIGEAYGAWALADDDAIMAHLELANVACGFHAGDPTVMASTVRLAKKYGVEVGAHPSYPDLQGFGRRAMKMDPDELTATVVYQCGALKGFLEAEGMSLTYVKPHGALYGAGARDETVARAVADAAAVFGVPIMGMAGTAHESSAKAAGVGFMAEYYADLEYDDDGFLIITRKHVAYDPDVGRAARAARDRGGRRRDRLRRRDPDARGDRVRALRHPRCPRAGGDARRRARRHPVPILRSPWPDTRCRPRSPACSTAAPAPTRTSSSQEGDDVESGATIGLVEIMKNFEAVETEVSGKLVEFLVSNEDEVTAGQAVAVVDDGG